MKPVNEDLIGLNDLKHVHYSADPLFACYGKRNNNCQIRGAL